MRKKPYYITTAISYVNGAPHLGHAYEVILTDVMARFQRLDNRDVLFLTGTDEHGEKVAKTAEANNMTPLEFADLNSGLFRNMAKVLNISNDDFIRTTETRHYAAAQALWKKLEDKGDIYLSKYEGWYSVREEAYFTEAELTKDEKTGELRTQNGTEVKWVEEESYFFRLSNYTDKLLAYYETHHEFIQPDARRNEIISFVKGGLKDLSVSRHKSRLSWGIPVPDDENHVMYVWLDALTNYITALGYPEQEGSYKTHWPQTTHVIGKDITRFHAVYWPAFLMSADIPLPQKIFAHGFINVEGQKMSKSIGNVMSPDGLVETYGLDPIRYYLLREIPHGQDGNFSHGSAILRINADLANGLGNLVQRTLSMIYKNCDEAIPQPSAFSERDQDILRFAYEGLLLELRQTASAFQFHRSLEIIWRLVHDANAYIDEQAPWALKKTDPERMKTVLYVLAEVIRCLGIVMQPFTPDSAEKILSQLGVSAQERFFENLSGNFALKPSMPIAQPVGVFPRIQDDLGAQDQKQAG